MQTLEALEPGQGLRLLVGFEPVPLYGVMQARGFTPTPRNLPGGDWEVLFRPAGAADPAEDMPASENDDWPAPAVELDNRGLLPPEPMVRILAAVENLSKGEVVSALLDREPVFLFPELQRRGHAWRGSFTGDGLYALSVQVGSAG
jgi:uncharacterized protein (DUF2249 family)